MRVTEAGLAVLRGDKSKSSRTNKYHAEKITEDGYLFASLVERCRYRELKLLLAGKLIRNLRVHHEWELMVNGELVGTYTDDFDYEIEELRDEKRLATAWILIVEDVKSSHTQRDKWYRRTKKLMQAIHGIEIREVMR